MAQAKYKDCISSVNAIDTTESTKMMVPLTSSLYVPGKIKKENFKIDIGTGYFVEKDSKQAQEFFTKRITKLDGDSTTLKNMLTEKMNLMETMDNVIKEKIIASQKGQEQKQKV